MRTTIVTILLFLCVSDGRSQPDTTALDGPAAAELGQQTVEVLLGLAKAVQRNDPRLSIDHAEKALVLAEQQGDEAGRAQALSYIGIGHYYLGDYQQALRNYQESLRTAEHIGDKARIASALNNIGIINFVWGEHDQALDFYFRSLRLQQELNDAEGIAKGYNNLANVYHTAGEYDQALSYYRQSLDLYEQSGNRQLVAGSLNNIGLLHYDMQRYAESLRNYEQALAIKSGIDDRQGMALSLNNMGMVFEAWRRFPEALERYRESLAIREEIGDRQGVSVCLHNIGTVLSEQQDHDQAIDYLERALAIATALDIAEIVRDNNLSLAEAHTRAGNHQRALEYYQQYKAAHDVIFNQERSRQMAAAQARYEVDLKDGEIEMLRKDKEIERARRNVLLVGAGLFLLIILLLFNRYRFQKRAHFEIQQSHAALRQAHADLEKAARDELAHVARVATMGELAAAFAHELNQPLTAIRTNARAGRNLLAAANPDTDEVHETLNDIAADTDRARQIILRLRALMRKGEIKREALDIGEMLQSVETFAAAEARRRGIDIRMTVVPELPAIAGDRIQLQQVVLNLVQNGSAAMARGSGSDGVLRILASLRDEKTVDVAVRDSGPVIDDAAFSAMFEPFFTTKSEGLGMGLPICRTIIEAHGGQLWAERNDERGLTVRFTLPAG